MKCVVVVYFIHSFIAKQDIILYNKQNKKTEKVQAEKSYKFLPSIIIIK